MLLNMSPILIHYSLHSFYWQTQIYLPFNNEPLIAKYELCRDLIV